MWGRENSSSNRFFQRLAILLISGFVLLQMVVFIIDTFRYSPAQPAQYEIIHDTVFVDRMVPVPGSSGRIRRSAASSGNIEYRKPSVQLSDSVRKESETPVSGDSKWKWDVVEINSADSAALDGLPGIGGYYAKQILRYRKRLGAFTDVWQLVEIRGLDSAKVARLAPRVRIDSSFIRWIDLQSVQEDVLSAHPYVGRMASQGIIRLRECVPPEEFTLMKIVESGIMTEDEAFKLARYVRK